MKTSKIAAFAAVSAFACWNNPAAANNGLLCDTAARLVPDLACAESARGVAMAGSAERAQYLLGLAQDGTARFVTHFGHEPLR